MLSFIFSLFLIGSSCLAAAIMPTEAQYTLPAPTGPFSVGLSIAELVDHSRVQPFAPSVEPVRLMISVFYPVDSGCSSRTAAYMPPLTARFEDEVLGDAGLNTPNGTFEKVRLHVSDTSKSKKQHGPSQNHPLVLFMGAEGTNRLFYSAIATQIASHGFTIVTIDTPYDVDNVEYPDESVAFINQTAWQIGVGDLNYTALAQTAYLATETRVADVRFVLDALSNTTLAHQLIPNLPKTGLSTTHTAMFGHSLGGAAAFSALQSDNRILGGLNMDGGLFGPGLTTVTRKPFMFMAHANHTRNNSDDDPLLTWQTAWSSLTGWKRDVIVADTEHYDFSDYPLLFETIGITPNASIAAQILLGPLKGSRTFAIVTTYVTAFLRFVLNGEHDDLLDGPVRAFPEVTFEY